MLKKLVNCATHLFEATLPDARHYKVLVAKRAYDVEPTGALVPRPEQELLYFSDTGYGAPNETSLLYPSDIVPFKPVSDVIVAAEAIAPDNQASPTWLCGLRVEGEETVDVTLRVYGPRQWEPEWLIRPRGRPTGRRPGFCGWTLSAPKPVKRVPIRYENAWGGQSSPALVAQDGEVRVCETNPIGSGWIDPELTDHTAAVAAPQVEWAKDRQSDDAYAMATPAGLGPIMPAWLPRRHLGGTFDQNWIDTQRPWWPQDYQFGFHNAAPPWMQWRGYLRGDETIRLHNLVSHAADFMLKLPETGLVLAFQGQEWRMALDTLLLDVRAADTEDWVVTLTWRLVMPPDVAAPVVLDEVYLDHPRYQKAKPPTGPQDVAGHKKVEPEVIHG